MATQDEEDRDIVADLKTLGAMVANVMFKLDVNPKVEKVYW